MFDLKQTTKQGLLLLSMALAVTPVYAKKISMDVALSKPALLADTRQTTVIKVDLTGFEMIKKDKRTLANVALVLDKSGSMNGEKLRQARKAAEIAVERLSEDDILSIITYDDKVDVILPATKVSDKSAIKHAIRKITAGGSTALFSGVSKGAEETRKFIDRENINRIILLSDGLANVGPSSPHELAKLGTSFSEEGISVTTIGLGLGYNEDLMTRLAGNSGGNHAFAENAVDLRRIFQSEFDSVLSVVAQEVNIKIECAEGIRPIKVLGREAEIYGQTVAINLSQLYSNQTKYLLLEVEVPQSQRQSKRKVADVSVKYANMYTKQTDSLNESIYARFTESSKVVEQNTNADVMGVAVEQKAIETSKQAVELRDKGKIKEAQKILRSNASMLGLSAKKYKNKKLEKLKNIQEEEADMLGDSSNWNKQRKQMRSDQHKWETQQTY